MIKLDRIQEELEAVQNKEEAKKMEKYMRNHFPFLGVKTPERRKAVKTVLKQERILDFQEIRPLLQELWLLSEREYQNVALDLLGHVKHFPKESIALIEQLIVTKSWWDTVDSLSGNSAGNYFKQHPEEIKPVIDKWIKSENMWLNRSAILFQLSYKETTDWPLLKQVILLHSDSKEFFIQKAIGWALREYSKTAPETVATFMNAHPLAPLSKREGSKILKKNKTEVSK
ncbi:DNA alkylation repair protein [Pseudalkalibacillus hwajinpoensis]|uniref:DNA alkylation repair protein n=1 Tax=Guptibacillus hwajinpoensis TaxID=208199 RepID=UPI001CD4C826|nr:DNA alkylation repair protein [Pseudalkalibacillus hwajinpoensis]